MDRWKCLSEWKDDALLEFGPFETDELKAGMVFWYLHLSDYSHDLWPHLFKEKGSGASSSGDGVAAKGAVVYTLAQHQALVRQDRVSEGQAADTHASCIQLHGTSVRPCAQI